MVFYQNPSFVDQSFEEIDREAIKISSLVVAEVAVVVLPIDFAIVREVRNSKCSVPC